MLRNTHLLLSLLIFVLVAPVSVTGLAADADRRPEQTAETTATLSLIPGQDAAAVAQFLHVLETPAGVDLETVLQPGHRFRRNTEEFFNPGTTREIIWIRLDVQNPTDEPGQWILSLNRALLNDVGIFQVSEGNARVLLDDSRDSLLASYREFRTLAGRFSLPSGSSSQIYVRYRPANWGGLAPLLVTEQSFRTAMMADLTIYLLLLGGMITIVAIGSISFVFLGQKVVIYYALAQIAYFAFYTHFTSISTVYLFPEHAQSLGFVSPLTMGLFVIFICLFARHFFETPGRFPLIDRTFLGLIGTSCLAFALMLLSYVIPFVKSQLPLVLFYLALMGTWTILPGLAIYATWKWHRAYWPLIVAWTSTGLFMIIMQMTWIGVISTMPLQENIFGVFIYIEAAFLALAIALRVQVIREEALLTEQRLSESLRAGLQSSERAKRLYEEREWALHDLAEKGRLLLTAGHDTRQMISALRNYSAGIRNLSREDRVEQATLRIDDIAENLNEVLTTVIDGSRSGGITDSTLALDTIAPEKIINAVLLVHQFSASEKNIAVRKHVSAGLLVTDRILVGRVLSNFLANAIKYSGGGNIVVACRPCRGGHRFQVWDQGIGIDPVDLATLLDTKTGALRLGGETEGQGTGLSIVKNLAVRLGGRVHARSVPGRGSMFELILPEASLFVDRTNSSARRLSVVLADGDTAHAEIFNKTLSACGLSLTHWSDPAHSTLSGKRSGKVDLLFVDEHFGGASHGIEFLHLHAAVNSDTIVVLLSYDRSIEARAAMAKEADSILYKPVSSAAIRAVLVHAISNQKTC